MRLASVAALAVVLGLAVSAHADEHKERARELLQQGNAKFAHGAFKEALVLFQQAYGFYPSAKLLINTAACHRALGRSDRAASDLSEFVRQASLPTASAEEVSLAGRTRLDLDLLTDGLGSIAVEDVAPETTVEVDNEPGWLLTYVAPGDHNVNVHEPRRGILETRVHVNMSERVSVRRPGSGATLVDEPKAKRRWVLPVAIAGGVLVVALGLGLGLGLGLHRGPTALRGDLGTVPFNP